MQGGFDFANLTKDVRTIDNLLATGIFNSTVQKEIFLGWVGYSARITVMQLPRVQCTKVRFASLLSGGFTTMTVINPPERKLAKRTSVQCGG